MDPAIIDLMRYARVPMAVNVKPGEHALIIADTNSHPLVWQTLAAAVAEVGGEPTVVIMTPRSYPMENPTDPIAAAMLAADVNVLTVTKALIHSPAARAAMAAGKRFVNLEEANPEMLTMTKETVEDIQAMQEVGRRLTRAWTEGREYHLTAPNGTDLRGGIEGRPGYYVAAVAQPQEGVTLLSCAFPDGEAGISPVESTSDGTVVCDIAMLAAGIGRVDAPVTIRIAKGRITEITGGRSAEQFRRFIEQFGDDAAYELAEVSVGMNPKIKLTGNKADKKSAGTAHVGFGANTDTAGVNHSKLHMDGVLDKPTLRIDGRLVVDDGRIVV